MGAEQLITEGYYLSSSTSNILFRIESFLRTRPALLACILILLPAGLAITAMVTLIEMMISYRRKPNTSNYGSDLNVNNTINHVQEHESAAAISARCSASQLVLLLLIDAAAQSWDELMNESDDDDGDYSNSHNTRPYYRPRYEYIYVPIDPPCPLDPNSIASIPVLQYHEYCSRYRPDSCIHEMSSDDHNDIHRAVTVQGTAGDDSEQSCCMVCLNPFAEEIHQLVRVLPRCHHAFHVSCIDTWFGTNSTCPLCRLKVTLDDDCDNSHGFIDQLEDHNGHVIRRGDDQHDIIVHVNDYT